MVSDVAVENVERSGSGGSHVHGDWDCVAVGSAAGYGGAALGNFLRGVFSAAIDEEPKQSGGKIHQINVRELAVGSFGNGIGIADQCEQHGEAREPGKNWRPPRFSRVVGKVSGQREPNKHIGDDKTVGGEGAEPAVNVEAACA